MYADNTLTPKEAARLCALGTLADGDMNYGQLANAVRHFMDRIQGPSLDVMGASLELLRYEGLVHTVSGDGDSAVFSISVAGRVELETLLTSNIRPGATDHNKLVIALKFRYLHLLDRPAREAQLDALIDAAETELARLCDLRAHHAGDVGHIGIWLDHQIDELELRLNWLADFKSQEI